MQPIQNNTKASTGNCITSKIESTASSSSYNYIKTDSKAYRGFNGQTKDRKKFKIQFRNIVTICGIYYLMEEDHLIPNSPKNIYKQATNDNTFLYSMAEHLFAKRTTMSRI